MNNNDWAWARRLAVSEKRLLRRHGRAVMMVALLHGLLILVFWRLQLFHGHAPLVGLLLLALLAWSSGYAWLIGSGRTLGHHEPSLSLPMSLGLMAIFLATAFPLDKGRICAVMLFYPLLLLVSFRLVVRSLLILVLCASLGYGLMLALAVVDHGVRLNVTLELLQWLVFTLVGTSFALSGGGLNGLRRSLAIKNRALADALEQVRDLAIRDDLTGLFNRRHIIEVLSQQKALADHQTYPFAVCYVDLDYFKRINDVFGHGWGDKVLRLFAEHTLGNLREGDYLARLGGEEFIMVLPQSDLEGAVRVAERLCHSWAQRRFDEGGGPRRVSLSAGVACYRRGETVDQLLARADHALYLAKTSGRNKVCKEVES